MNDIRVLIVDGDPTVAGKNKSFTEKINGFTVVGIARSGKEALTLCRNMHPDLITLDIYMSGLDGMAILANLRRIESDIDIIMITAANDSTTISRAIRFGISGYIIKPFNFERYRSVLESYREFHRKILQSKKLDQIDIDRVFAVNSEYGAMNVPKNFHICTMKTILNFLATRQESLSAEEVAAGIGISRVTARRYLEYLVSERRLERLLEYISVGRPIHRFRLTFMQQAAQKYIHVSG